LNLPKIQILNLKIKRYNAGIITKVKKVAKDKPYMIAQDIGPKNRLLSPPIKIFGS
jgi:hypothetical protein